MSLVVLYGGTFDPVHAGHIAVARAARDTLDADIALLPAADPPHRAAPGASAAQRRHMLQLALAGEPRLHLDDRELQRPGRSYTVDTLLQVRAERGPDQPLAWLLGDDSFRGLPSWHRWRELLGLAHLMVALRPGHALDDLPPVLEAEVAGRWVSEPADLRAAPAGRLFRLALPPHPASASGVRARLAAGQGDGGWLAPAVAAFIAGEGLYRAPVVPPGV